MHEYWVYLNSVLYADVYCSENSLKDYTEIFGELFYTSIWALWGNWIFTQILAYNENLSDSQGESYLARHARNASTSSWMNSHNVYDLLDKLLGVGEAQILRHESSLP